MKNITIFGLSLLVLLSACKKDDPVIETSKKLVKMTNANKASDFIAIEYDAQGRVTKSADESDEVTITYNGNEVKIKEWRTTENREVFSFTGKLNEKGYVTQGIAVSQYNQSSVTGQTFTFEYNNDGYMTKKTRTDSNGDVYVYEYTYSKGNMTAYKVYRNGVFDWGGTWEYSDTPADKSNLNWEQFNGPNKFTGKTNKLLPSKYTGSTGWYVNFSYTLDNQGYPTSVTSTYDDGDVYKFLYTFE
ncbi:MAG TPA: DUF4595 domain-containing protein [Saprospiraceae bacterium]|nr:DUF4595 domain-containing protein [Saprospiraceae bacterium]